MFFVVVDRNYPTGFTVQREYSLYTVLAWYLKLQFCMYMHVSFLHLRWSDFLKSERIVKCFFMITFWPLQNCKNIEYFRLRGVSGGLSSKLFLTAGPTKNCDQVVEGFIQSGLGNLQEYRLHNDSGKLAPTFNRGHSVKFCPYVGIALFNLWSLPLNLVACIAGESLPPPPCRRPRRHGGLLRCPGGCLFSSRDVPNSPSLSAQGERSGPWQCWMEHLLGLRTFLSISLGVPNWTASPRCVATRTQYRGIAVFLDQLAMHLQTQPRCYWLSALPGHSAGSRRACCLPRPPALS